MLLCCYDISSIHTSLITLNLYFIQVHALETTCLLPSLEEEGGEDFSEESVEELFKSLYETEDEDGDGDEDGPVISRAEANALQEFLTDEATRPPLSMLIWLR